MNALLFSFRRSPTTLGRRAAAVGAASGDGVRSTSTTAGATCTRSGASAAVVSYSATAGAVLSSSPAYYRSIKMAPCFSSMATARSSVVCCCGRHDKQNSPPLLQHQQQRFMSKYLSKSAKKRLVLTTKRAHKDFYKGKGATKEGRLTSTGKFVVDPLKRVELVVPDLTGCRLKPYIASTASRFPPEQQHNPVPR